ncbi:MAG: AAA family ATPase [Burkholderiales bacterium]|nr:AAA family ATPase [Burkholderiales bacterium]
MYLYSLQIEGFRKLNNTTVYFGDSTFLIGENNKGKSSIFKALELVLNLKQDISEHDYFSIFDIEESINKQSSDKIILTAEFRGLPPDAPTWRGFKGRIANDNGELIIKYRKTFNKGTINDKGTIKPIIEMLQNERILKIAKPKKWREFVSEDITEELIASWNKDLDSKPAEQELEEYNELWDIDNSQTSWVKNPGGIPQIVSSKLPDILIIPAEDKTEELESKGALSKILETLFKDVRNKSENFKNAEVFLNKLSAELDPSDETSDFGKLMSSLNQVLDSVFPESSIMAKADLSKADDSIKAIFNINMKSNIITPISHQGTGAIRAAVFGLLLFRQQNLLREQSPENQNLIVCFEEPEIYLHPNAANQMRNKIYELASTNTQIICTTHSPYMISLDREVKQVLNNFIDDGNGGTKSISFNTHAEYLKLQDNDKEYIKMLARFDDSLARVFFARKTLIVEGDTEEIVLRETINRMSPDKQKIILSEIQIIKARGKATIIPLVKYLKALSIDLFVIHDSDTGTAGAERFNEPILTALNGDSSKLQKMDNCIEDVLGYAPPSSEKPFKAYQQTKTWGASWSDVPEKWRKMIEQNIFKEYFIND